MLINVVVYGRLKFAAFTWKIRCDFNNENFFFKAARLPDFDFSYSECVLKDTFFINDYTAFTENNEGHAGNEGKQFLNLQVWCYFYDTNQNTSTHGYEENKRFS